MNDSRPAIFLSYAHEDAAGARRIADALRSAGIEVWFDESELRGGDTWDAKIRQQIDACALFIPIISRNTQERGKGYFRLEWKLAVDQTYLLAAGIPFVAPVVIDETRDAEALVPPEFMKVQWTRLPGALPTPGFVAQMQRLLAPPNPSLRAPSGRAPGAPAAAPVTPTRSSRVPLMIGVGALVIVGVGLFAWLRPDNAPRTAAPVGSDLPASRSSLPAPATDKSIAVLPFTNMSEDKDTGFFADGVHEDLLTNLAIVPELKVVSRTSVLQYRGTTKNMRQIGQELGVAYLLEGSVRRAGNKVRVTGQLIKTDTDEHLWAKSYDRDLTDIFAIQSAIAQEISAALSAAISPEVRKHLDRRPTDNPAAYDLFLKARDLRNNSATGVLGVQQEAERLYQGAVDLDPKFAAAWGELAVVHALYGFWGMDHTPERIAKGEAAMQRAEQLAPNAPDVIRVRGTYAYYAFRDYATATAAYQRLARLQPNDPTVYNSLALISRRQGRWTESINYFRRAVELDPASYNSLRNLGVVLAATRHWDEERAVQQRIIALRPDSLLEQYRLAAIEFDRTGSVQALVAWLAGLSAAARNSPEGIYVRKLGAVLRQDAAEFRRLDRLQPFFAEQENSELSVLVAGSVYAAEGDTHAVRERVADALARYRSRLLTEAGSFTIWMAVGELESQLGNHDEALRMLGKAQNLVPESKDALDGTMISVYGAIACARRGDKDRAIAELTRLLQKPLWNWSVHTIRVDPGFANLRGDPRFEALLNDPKNNTPLY